MSGRILTERLLATTSLAALIFAAAAPDASALPACTIVPAGGSYSNSGSVACVEVTTASISITNNVGATIGSPPKDEAVIVAVGATLSGGITNSGTIIDTRRRARYAGGILVDGLVQGGSRIAAPSRLHRPVSSTITVRSRSERPVMALHPSAAA